MNTSEARMESQQALNRTCPTRTDGARALLAHKVSTATCSDKQRKRYHKCYTCQYNHAYVAQNGLPDRLATAETRKSRPAT